MATGTLQLAFDDDVPVFLRSWDAGNFHQFAVVEQSLRPNIFLAEMGLLGGRARHTVIVKVAVGTKETDALKREHSIYKNHLAKLQGSYVPRCYGLFTSQKLPGGCLLLEYIEPHTDKVVDPEEYHQQFMVAVLEIHKAGVEHGNLKAGHVLQKGYSPCIIDFSTARTHHRCSLFHEPSHEAECICEELYEAERWFTTASIGASGSSTLGFQKEGDVKVTADSGIRDLRQRRHSC